MKTYKNLYTKIYSFKNLYLAFIKAKRKKRYKKGVAEFEYCLEKNLFSIQRELKTFIYQPSMPKKFILREPKKRTIFVVDFRDRVVHHALCNIIEPIFEKSFIFDSHACRKGKGTHRAIRRFDEFKRRATSNNSQRGFVLKMDIRKYFDTVNHKILLMIINQKLKDKNTNWLIKEIVENHEGKGNLRGKGIPIGNLTSQLFANIYLNELDHFIKEKMNIKYYIRYMDDVVIMGPSIDCLLETKEKISRFLDEKLNLKLHPRKTRIFPLEKGITFLGYQNFYYYKLLRRGAVKRIKQKLEFLASRYRQGEIDLSRINNSAMAWLGYARHANTYYVRKDILRNLNFLVEI